MKKFTTYDGRQVMAIAHLTLWVRWAKMTVRAMVLQLGLYVMRLDKIQYNIKQKPSSIFNYLVKCKGKQKQSLTFQYTCTRQLGIFLSSNIEFFIFLTERWSCFNLIQNAKYPANIQYLQSEICVGRGVSNQQWGTYIHLSQKTTC